MSLENLLIKLHCQKYEAKPGSVKANGKEPKSFLGQVFNFKLGCFVMYTIVWPIQARQSLEFKTQPMFCPVSSSLSMLKPFMLGSRAERPED